MDPPPQEGEEPGAHGVRPVQVLDDDDDRLLGRQGADQLEHRLEEQRGRRRRRGWVGRGQELGKKRRELRARGSTETLANGCVECCAAAPERLDPRPEGQRLLGLVAAAERQPAGVERVARRELLDQPALADSRLAGDQHHVAPGVEHARERLAQALELARPSDHRRVHATRARRRGERRGRPPERRVGRLQDLPVELAGLLLGLGAELAPQARHAGLVLLQRHRAPSLT